MSPTIHREKGYRFSFYSWEGNEEPHVHVEKGGGYAKLWLSSDGKVTWAYSDGFGPRQQSEIEEIATARLARFLEEWHEHFKRGRPGQGGRAPPRRPRP